MPVTKEDIKAMTMEERMALIDTIWEVTDEENPQWKEERSKDDILADPDEGETTGAAPAEDSKE